MIETNRLKIIPLTYRQLIDYLRANDILEEQLGLVKTGRILNEDIRDMVENFTLPNMKKANHDNYLFFTFWIVIDRVSNFIVAELGFKGVPNYQGEIEIGYGTMPDHQGKGYMTEAVQGMLEWAKQRNDVNSVLAETHQDNLASIHIVQKNGFVQFNKKGQMLWWRKMISNPL